MNRFIDNYLQKQGVKQLGVAAEGASSRELRTAGRIRVKIGAIAAGALVSLAGSSAAVYANHESTNPSQESPVPNTIQQYEQNEVNANLVAHDNQPDSLGVADLQLHPAQQIEVTEQSVDK